MGYDVWTNRMGRNEPISCGWGTIASARQCARRFCASDQREGAQYWVEANGDTGVPMAAPYVCRNGRPRLETIY